MRIIALSGQKRSGKHEIINRLISNMQSERRYKTISISDRYEPEQMGIFEDVLKMQTVYVFTCDSDESFFTSMFNKAKNIYHADLMVTISHTDESRSLILKEDENAEFIETDKYNQEDWISIPDNNKLHIKNVYVGRIEREI